MANMSKQCKKIDILLKRVEWIDMNLGYVDIPG